MWLSLSPHAWLTITVLVAMVAGLVLEIATPEIILFAAFVLLLLGGAVSPDAAFDGFSNHALLTVAALFVVAGAARRTGALATLKGLMAPKSSQPVTALVRLMLPSSVASSLVNNTPVVAVLTPLVQQWGRLAGVAASKLLIPLSHATMLGGMCTLVGTSTNLVVSGLLEQEQRAAFSMFELAWVGVPATALGLLYYVTIGHRLLPERPDQTPYTRVSLRTYQFELRVPAGSPLVGQEIGQAGLRSLKGAFLAHIVRADEIVGPVEPTQHLDAGDVLVFFGNPHVLDHLLEHEDLERLIEPVDDPPGAARLPLFEAVVSAQSWLVGKSLKQAGFRRRYQGVVLGIRRAGHRLRRSLGRTPLEAGDLLLVEARPDFEERWTDSGDFYLVAPLERTDVHTSSRAPLVLVIIGAMVLSVTVGWLPAVVAAFGAAALTIAFGALPASEARRAVDLSVLIVIASAFGIGRAIEQSGLAEHAAHIVVLAGQGLGPIGVLAAVYIITNVLTEFLTNNVAAVLVFPVGFAAALQTGQDPRAFAVAIAIAASASFATPIGYQTNLMVMGPGGYRFNDYVKVGLPLNLLIMALSLWLIPAVWF